MKFKWKVLLCCAAVICTSAMVGNPAMAGRASVDSSANLLSLTPSTAGDNVQVGQIPVSPALGVNVTAAQTVVPWTHTNLPSAKVVVGNTGGSAPLVSEGNVMTRGGGGLLCAYTEADNAAFRAAVSAIIGMPVDYYDARTGTPTLEQMQGYLGVLTWVNYAYSNPILMGDTLADYVDAGGKVILGQWTENTGQTNRLQGRIMDLAGPYLPCDCLTRTSGTYSDGGGVTCIHLGLATVTTYATDYRDNCTVIGAGLSDGQYTDGTPAQFYNAGLPVFYSPGQMAGMLGATGQWAELAANSLFCGDPIPGACCQEDTGVCADDVLAADCIGSGPYARWIFEGQCAELEPECGEIMGACCFDTECSYLKPSDCDAMGGAYSGDFVPCDPNPCLCADHFVTAPLLDWTGNTCGAGDDCPIRAFEDIQFQVTIPYDATWVFSLCGTGYDCWHYMGDECCTSTIFSQDDSSQCGLQGYIELSLSAGVYHYTVDAYSGCGAVVLNIYPLLGACCLPDDPYCEIMGEAACAAAGGDYGGHGSECDFATDCDGNGQPDECQLALGIAEDCNGNGVLDACDIAEGFSPDVDGNGVPDECQEDCNENGILDGCDITCDGDCIIFYPETCGGSVDCQPDGIPDECQLGTAPVRGGGAILYAPSQPDDAAFRAAISAISGGPVDYFDARSGVPSAALLEGYDAVFTWANYAYADSTGMGNALADFVDAGGAVGLGQWCLCTAGNCLGGRIMNPAEGYLPVTGTSWTGPKSYAGDGDGCWTEGVSSYNTNWCDNASAVAGAEVDGTYTDGTPLVAWFPGVTVASMPGVLEIAGGTTGENEVLVAHLVSCFGPGGSDCDGDLIPDDCDIQYCGVESPFSHYYPSTWECQDCDENGLPDICDIAENGDCNENLVPDNCDIDYGFSEDCNEDRVPDECQLEENDCNENGVPDDCDIDSGESVDCNDNGIPDECEPLDDCNGDGIPDICDADCNENGISDACDIFFCDGSYWCLDCQPDGVPDGVQLGDEGRGGSGTILYAPSEADNPAFRAEIAALTGAAVDYLDPRTATPTLEQLMAYELVFTWANYAYADATAYGNNLADYVDAGGKVVLGQWCLCTAGNCLGGRIMDPTQPYLPVAGSSWVGPKSYAGDGDGCFTEGVVSYTTNWCDNATLVDGALLDGTYTDGTPLVAYFEGGTVAYMAGVLEISGGTVGENEVLIANALTCLGGQCAGGEDCNGNLIPDECDIASGFSIDCDADGVPDECEPDCNDNGVADDCDIADGTSQDCNENGIPDECDIDLGTSQDCQPDGIPDECQLEFDCNDNDIPDECEPLGDCNDDGIADICDPDCNENGISDVCDILFCDGSFWCQDCQPDGVPDGAQLGEGLRGDPNVLFYSEFEFSTTIYETALTNLGWTFTFHADPNTLAGVLTAGEWTHIIINHTNTGADYPWQQALVDYMTANPDTGLIVSDWRNPARTYLTDLGFSFSGTNYTSLTPVAGGVFDGLAPATLANPGYGIFSVGTVGGIVEATNPSGTGAINHIEETCWFAFGPAGDVWADPNLGAEYAIAALEACGAGCIGGEDCNGNLVPDECDIRDGFSDDCNENDIPDECEPDCNDNGVADDCDIAYGTSQDCNEDGIPDECQLDPDCNENGVPDDCDIADGTSGDCNLNGIPDECDLADCDGSAWCQDCNETGTPDECDLDCEPGRATLYCQAGIPDDTGVGSTGLLATGSDLGQSFIAIDNFILEEEGEIIVNQFSWQAIYFGGSTDCPDGHYVEVRMYDDSFALLRTWEDVSYTRTTAARPPIFGTYPVYDFMSDVVFPPFEVTQGVQYWIAVVGNPDTIGCAGTFGWVASAEGDLQYYQDTGAGFALTDADVAFCLFGETGPPPCDCNDNGIPDECDIADGTSLDCNGNGIPDECGEEILCGDLNGDGIVDFTDREILRAAMGSDSTDDNWNGCADYDGDGTITLVDYQMWRACYLASGGKTSGIAPFVGSSSTGVVPSKAVRQ